MTNNDNQQPAEPSGIDKRTYSRVAAYFQASYRRVGSPDEPQLCPRQQSADDGTLASQLSSGSSLPTAVARFLINMDAKLDSILALMQKENLDEFFPGRLMVLDVSASGVLVQSDSLQVDEFIELVMYLGEFPPRIASGIGRVIRPAHAKDDKTFAVQFINLRDSDREQIVRYVFKEERERIRSEKLK